MALMDLFSDRFIVAVTGGRDLGVLEDGWTSRIRLLDHSSLLARLERYEMERAIVMNALTNLHGVHKIAVIRNGGMTGADALSSRWAHAKGVDTECYGAQWGDLGSAAGPFRSRTMLSGGGHAPKADLLLAFPGGRGTQVAIAIAQSLGLPVREITNIGVIDHNIEAPLP